MVDFLEIAYTIKKDSIEVYPKFRIMTSSDLMIRGRDFYAIWVEQIGLWSTDEEAVVKIIDNEMIKYVKDQFGESGNKVRIKYMWDSSSGSIDAWHKYCQKQMRDNFHPLDEKLIFSNTKTSKEDYASKRLAYPLEVGTIQSWNHLIGTLYSPEERHKIEWAIGAIVSGESKYLQKFMVLYGSAGTGKSTIINVIQKLFDGYCSVFDARALGSSSNSFALEAFKRNPLVAIQHDGDLSRIEDNTRLNSLVSHEYMTVNEKFKAAYENKFNAFLLMGTNKPVKITDAKSGLIRRLIDVTPSGEKLKASDYRKTVKGVDFELGAIAKHCLDIFEEDPGYYDDYVPINMLGSTNDFYNFIQEKYYIFKQEENTTLKIAWEMYKSYCEDAMIQYPYPKRVFKEELKNYFREYRERDNDEARLRSRYIGFLYQKIDGMEEKHERIKEESASTSLYFEEGIESVFDVVCKDCPAQLASPQETPTQKWVNVKTTLESIDTSRLHYVKVPENHIVIDFDIPGPDGKKNFEMNLQAASQFPPTYAELSKSGAGIHLHYIYTGDVNNLSRVYDDHVEIKIFTGGSSLRRKLTKCNDLPIASISTGLPVKGDKMDMINFDAVKSEKGIRTLIKRNLNKEYHPATKPSVDFIFTILQESYESGLHYDVTDMRPAVLAFAAGSTNQSDICIKMVSKMKFKSEEASLPTTESDVDELVFYDVEVFPNLFLVNYKIKGNPVVIRMINPTPEQIEDILRYKLVGFNCRKYDNHIMYARLMGYTNEELFRLSQRIIANSPNCMFGEAYNLSYTDVYDFASAGNKMSLKKWEIKLNTIANAEFNKAKRLMANGYSIDEAAREIKWDVNILIECLNGTKEPGIQHHELGLPWDEPVPEDMWYKVAEYCDSDVIATEAVFDYLKGDWTARQILADLAGMTVNDTTNSLTTRVIFGTNRRPQGEFFYRDMSKPVSDISEELYGFLEEACPQMMSKTHGDAGSLLPYFPEYKYEFGTSTYRGEEVGEGGYVYSEPGMYGNVALLDVASMHPHSLIAECLFGIRYTEAFRDIVEGRVEIKHENWDVVNEMLDGKLTPYVEKVKNGEMKSKDLANALKTAINSVYGLTSAKFENPFHDERNKDNIVAKRGALFMIDLKYEVQRRGFKVAHIKTDSIKIPDATPEIIKFVMDFGADYGYTFEHEATYDRMCLVNKAVYIAKYATKEKCEELYGYCPGDNFGHGGQWTATGDEFAVPYTFKTLFSKEPLEFSDFCETFQVSKGNLYLDMNETLADVTAFEKELETAEKKFKKGELSDTSMTDIRMLLEPKIAEGHNLKFVGRVGSFTPVKENSGGGVLYRVNEGKNYAASGSSGYRWLESDMVKGHDELIDKSFYRKLADDSITHISQHGDYHWFVSDEPYISPEYHEGILIKKFPVYPDEPLPFN